MKHCFIINPASGKTTTKEGLEEKIKETCARIGEECYILVTKKAGDAQGYIREFYNEHRGDEIRFYACGGDGTLCEVVNGVMKLDDRENISVGVVPVGTGNDFVRNFEPKELFLDIDAQIGASPVKIDLIRCNDFYAVNMINIGFDCQVVCKTDEFKHSKVIPSRLAYICGLVATLIKKPGVETDISADGGENEHKQLLLTTFAKGRFCGGGFNSNPNSNMCDGSIDALFVKNISRTRFVSLVGSYKKGTHLCGKYDHILSNAKARAYSLVFERPTNISVDGEIVSVDRAELSCVRGALNFLVPKGIRRLPFDAELLEKKALPIT